MIDHVEIVVQGGNGGDGKVSFRRERFLPRGGPDGGDGGNGGSVILQCSSDVRSLGGISKRKKHRAEDGEPGGPNKKHGREGEDLVLKVPPGTAVRGKGEGVDAGIEAELVTDGERLVVAHGGRGGKGNARLATPVNQAPQIAERGQRGQEVRVVLDFKMLSDVGIVGLPNVGKSTLLRALTGAQPKVGPYPFTTTEPHVGVVEVGFETLILVELPAIVEGAHEGAGLGLRFLQHAERSRIFLHLVDGSRPDLRADLEAVNRELACFDPALLAKRQLVAVNKVDLPEVRARRHELQKALASNGGRVYFISAATQEGLGELVRALALAVRDAREQAPAATHPVPVLRPRPAGRFTIKKVESTFVVEGEQAVALVEMMGIDSDEARTEVLRRLRRMGVTTALRRAGVRPGDRVRFGEVEMEWDG